MSTTEVLQAVPTGTWKSDPVHSSVDFSVLYNGLVPFRGGFREFEATLADGRLDGSVQVGSITTEEENLTGHLLSPEFFDAERFPELRFEADELHREGDALVIPGSLTLRGKTQPVELRGTIGGPVSDAYGRSRIGLELETTIDRTAFGFNWNAPLPSGGNALENEVKLTANLQLIAEA